MLLFDAAFMLPFAAIYSLLALFFAAAITLIDADILRRLFRRAMLMLLLLRYMLITLYVADAAA